MEQERQNISVPMSILTGVCVVLGIACVVLLVVVRAQSERIRQLELDVTIAEARATAAEVGAQLWDSRADR